MTSKLSIQICYCSDVVSGGRELEDPIRVSSILHPSTLIFPHPSFQLILISGTCVLEKTPMEDLHCSRLIMSLYYRKIQYMGMTTVWLLGKLVLLV